MGDNGYRESGVKNSAGLNDNELYGIDAYWRACNYLAAGMIHLKENPL
ncbi:MAG: hypothetical protein HGA22_03040, partial [Clostridiales bacterium]|nr:hypothetical protein [Clostridiales bacterium]